MKCEFSERSYEEKAELERSTKRANGPARMMVLGSHLMVLLKGNKVPTRKLSQVHCLERMLRHLVSRLIWKKMHVQTMR